jgi:hypothetical protein
VIFFRGKLNPLAGRYDDILKAAHDRVIKARGLG